ncbi:MAG: PEP-CTERM sorting domain-containing protein [Verrucomicrobiota bacterium]
MKAQKYRTNGASYATGILWVSTLMIGIAANAQTLNDQNSTFTYNTASGAVGWTVDGVNQLADQSFYYRIGSSGPEYNITTISGSPTISNPDSRHLQVTYQNSSLMVDVLYVLTGNATGSGNSGVGATITVKNLGNTAMDMHFFQYTDFDLTGITGGQTGVFGQSGGRWNRWTQNLGTLSATDTFSSPSFLPSLVEAGYYNSTLASLTDGNPTTLNGTSSISIPGDVTAAIQWNAMFSAYGAGSDTLGISETMSLRVPEPTTLSLAGLGLLLALRRSRR